MMFTKNQIKQNYSWLVKSFLYENSKENEIYTNIICREDEIDVGLLFKTIFHWNVKTIPDKIYNKINLDGDNNYSHLLKYSIENGHINKREISIYAVLNENIKMLNWLKENNCLELYRTISNTASLHGKIECLKWLYQNDYEFDEYTFSFASNVEILDYLLQIGCRYNNSMFEDAIKNGNFERLFWLKENNFEMSSYLTEFAFNEGKTEELKWLVENGCPCSENILKILKQE